MDREESYRSTFYDVSKLVGHINSLLPFSEGAIEVELARVRRRNAGRFFSRSTVAHYELARPPAIAILHPFNMRGVVGSIKIHEGDDFSDDGDGGYEDFTLRLDELELRDGRVLPPCEVRLRGFYGDCSSVVYHPVYQEHRFLRSREAPEIASVLPAEVFVQNPSLLYRPK